MQDNCNYSFGLQLSCIGKQTFFSGNGIRVQDCKCWSSDSTTYLSDWEGIVDIHIISCGNFI